MSQCYFPERDEVWKEVWEEEEKFQFIDEGSWDLNLRAQSKDHHV
jgi:hypothetical protein